MKTTNLLIAVPSALVLVASLGCGPLEGLDAEGTSTLEGRVTNDEGYQAQSFGGEGATDAATFVQVSAIEADGSLSLVGEAEVDADGGYEVDVPAAREKLLVEAVDASGEVVAAAVLEASGAAGERMPCAPLTSESSLEARTFVEMIALGVPRAEANPIDVRRRVTARMAAAVRARHEQGHDVSEDVRALAEGLAAAQQTEVRAYARAGVETSQAALFEAQLEAGQALNAALHDATESAAEAYATFLAELDAAAERIGAEAEERARAESAASVAFRATLEARFDGGEAAAESAELREQALLAAAALEARALALATDAVLEAASAASHVRDEAEAAAAELRAEIALASSVSAAAAAFASYSAELIGEGAIEASILGAHLELDAASEVAAEGAVSATIAAAASLEAALEAALDAALATGGTVDTGAVADAVIESYERYYATVDETRAGLVGLGSDVDTTVSLLILAEGMFRL